MSWPTALRTHAVTKLGGDGLVRHPDLDTLANVTEAESSTVFEKLH